MKTSNTELIVERYYRLKNYLVETNVPILPQDGKQYWSDIDVLAVGEEVHLISCKDYLPSGKNIEQVIKNLNDSEKYIKREYLHLETKIFKKKQKFTAHYDTEILNSLHTGKYAWLGMFGTEA